MLKISLLGASGRMGAAIIDSMNDKTQLADAVERRGAKIIGQPVAAMYQDFKGEQLFVDTLASHTDVVIDFAAGEGLAAVAQLCATNKWALVTGRTGISAEDQKALKIAAESTAVLQAGNFSLGANLLMRLSALAAKALPDADIEIIETHHRFKKDAPSGTALALAEHVSGALGLDESHYIYGREGHTGDRPRDQIAIHTMRSGDTVGDHTVNLGVLGERLEFTHRALDRQVFARGALRAAQWVSDKKPGFYAMMDVLEI